MVAIPIRMYLATESKSVHFRLLCPHDHAPIKNKRWCPQEDREIAWTEAVRGYEVAKDEFVEVGDAELDNLPLPTAHTIEILEFVDDHDIDAGVYIKSAYYLEPEAVGVKPYYLLKSALEKTGRVAIGKIALRDREHLCRLALHDHGLLLNTLHWPDEIRDAGELSLPEREVEVHKRELDMAVMLVENLSASFDPERYRDDYREAVLEVVQAKLHNQPARTIPAAEPARVTDLMAALRASVEASKSARGPAAGAAPALATAAPPTAPKRAAARRGAASEAPVRRRKAS